MDAFLVGVIKKRLSYIIAKAHSKMQLYIYILPIEEDYYNRQSIV